MSNEVVTGPYEKTAEIASRFLEKLVGPSAEEIGLILQDKVRLWRVKNQISILNKAQEFCVKNKINPNHIPIKTLVPLLEYGSLEDDLKIQEKWASLLAHASDSTTENNIIASYAQMLSQLSSREVVILDRHFFEYESTSPDKREGLAFSTQKISDSYRILNEDLKIILGNLTRLHIIQAPASHGKLKIDSYPIVMRTNEIFQLTSFGIDFIKKCKYE